MAGGARRLRAGAVVVVVLVGGVCWGGVLVVLVRFCLRCVVLVDGGDSRAGRRACAMLAPGARRALRGAAFFVGFFGGAALTGTAGSTSLYTKSFSRTRSRTFIPTSWPNSPRVTSACSTCSESTRCSRFDVGP